jgi:hypothetical protein
VLQVGIKVGDETMTGKESIDHLNDALASIKSGLFIHAAWFMFEDFYKSAKNKMKPEQQQGTVYSIAETIQMIFKERYIFLREGELLSDGEANEIYEEAKQALGFDKTRILIDDNARMEEQTQFMAL